MQKHLIVVAGPTAVGKTAMAVRVAKHFNTDVISADSRQFYKEMAIGTAKPTVEEMDGVPHHFVDFLPIEQDYNAGAFERDVLELLEKLFAEKDVVVLAGGSGLYVDAVCKGFDSVPPRDEKLRAELQQKLEDEGIWALQDQLEKVDPEYYKQVDIHNPHRLMRALEVNLVSGKSYLEFRKQEAQKRPFNVIKIALNTDREVLYDRINRRVDIMMEQGQLEEARALYPKRELNSLQTVGYRELFEHFDGDKSLEDAIAMMKQNTRRFAKRQLTWLRRDENTTWFERDDFDGVMDYLANATK